MTKVELFAKVDSTWLSTKRKQELKTTVEEYTKALIAAKPLVSGSLSVDDCKWLIFYGHTKDKTVIINQGVGQLDYALNSMFMMMKESSRFDSDKVEKLFWERLQALANYR